MQQVPSELIVLNPDEYAEFVSSIAAIRTLIQTWQARGSFGFRRIPGLRDLSPVTLIRQALVKCPDRYPSTKTADLRFVRNKALREDLRKDITEVNSSFINGQWKMATVLGGSVIEALLLWKLQQQNITHLETAILSRSIKKSAGQLEKWDLHDYIEVADELKLIKPETVTQCRLAKDFRNLIHPGRAERLGQQCNRATALSAMAGLEHAVNDLTP